jgi:tetratricopeptide (TPR) repeat protein
MAALVIAGAIGMYFVARPSEKAVPPVAQTQVSPSPRIAEVPAVRQPLSPLPQPAVPARQVAPLSGELERTLRRFSDQVAPHLQAMINGSMANNESAISAGKEAIKQLPLPSRGNRIIARAANDAGLVALKAGDFNESLAKFDEAIVADPGDQEIADNRGYALMMAGKAAQSKIASQYALGLAPTRSSAWANLAAALAMEGNEIGGVGAYLLAFQFSKNQNKTRDMLSTLSQENDDQRVRDAATKALKSIAKY